MRSQAKVWDPHDSLCMAVRGHTRLELRGVAAIATRITFRTSGTICRHLHHVVTLAVHRMLVHVLKQTAKPGFRSVHKPSSN